jgi:hypothetical protein
MPLNADFWKLCEYIAPKIALLWVWVQQSIDETDEGWYSQPCSEALAESIIAMVQYAHARAISGRYLTGPWNIVSVL